MKLGLFKSLPGCDKVPWSSIVSCDQSENPPTQRTHLRPIQGVPGKRDNGESKDMDKAIPAELGHHSDTPCQRIVSYICEGFHPGTDPFTQF